MTDADKVAVQARAKVWYGLIVVVVVQLVLVVLMFLGAVYWATRNAEHQQGRVMCPLVLLLQSAYHNPATPDTPTVRQLRDTIDAMATALDCHNRVA